MIRTTVVFWVLWAALTILVSVFVGPVAIGPIQISTTVNLPVALASPLWAIGTAYVFRRLRGKPV